MSEHQEQHARPPLPDRRDPTLAGRMARRLTRRDISPGDIANLKRMAPDKPDSALFWQMMLRAGVTNPDSPGNDDHRLEQAWASILSTIAEGTKVGQDQTTSPHDERIPLGAALALANYHESRLNALLNADGETLLRLANQAAKTLYAKNQNFNCNDLARLMLSQLRTDAQRNADRVYLARHYHRTLYQAAQPHRSNQE